MMAMRDDPNVSAMMAAGLAGDNQVALTNALGRTPDASELYLAHFLGADGAKKFLAAMAVDPTQSAAAIPRRRPAIRRSFRSRWRVAQPGAGDGPAARQDGQCHARRGRQFRSALDSGLWRLWWRRWLGSSHCFRSAFRMRPIRQRWAARSPGSLLPPATAILPLPPAGSGSGAGENGGGNTRLSMADTLQNVFGGSGDGSAAPAACVPPMAA
jgi:hypothetical protein